MKKIFFLILLLICMGITLMIYAKKDNSVLGDGYYYLSRDEAMDIGFPGGGIVYKSNQKYLFSKIIVYGNVCQAINDETFIVASQNGNKNYLRKKHEKRQQLKYFIVNKDLCKAYGPFCKREFLKKRKELGVSKELQLDNFN